MKNLNKLLELANEKKVEVRIISTQTKWIIKILDFNKFIYNACIDSDNLDENIKMAIEELENTYPLN